MITQIKRWFQKLFAWLSWQDEPATTHTPTENHRNRGVNPEPIPRTPFDDTISHPGIAPQFGSQGDPRCSTMEEWHEPGSASMPRPQGANDNWQQAAPLPPPAPPLESARENAPKQGEKAFPALPPASAPAAQVAAPPMTPPPTPTAEQHLEFLRYLVRRGLVNEGFTEGQTPDQYRKK